MGVLTRPPVQAVPLLPEPEFVQYLDDDGHLAAGTTVDLPADRLIELYRHLVRARRLDAQATALVRQGRLAVYPSARGQEAVQVGAVLALHHDDWMFPTYRECQALFTRGVDPVGALTLLRGDWHCGYDPTATRCAPQTTPLATQAVHAAGFAYAAKRKGQGIAVLCFVGDGATSEGDFHEALNFAAVFSAPVVFVVQNNGWAISVPLSRQTAAPTLAHKGIGYGIPSHRVDGNDVLAVHTTVAAALERARAGDGPALIEAVTYRMEAHTNADDASRYRPDAEVAAWAHRDPIDRYSTWLRAEGFLDDTVAARASTDAEASAATLREAMSIEPTIDPFEMFDHVLAQPTPQMMAQRAQLAAELAADSAG